MCRRLIHFILILALCAQGLAFAGQSLAGGEAVAHAILHWQKVSHQHHEDGSVQVENSAESRSHAQLDPGHALFAFVAAVKAFPSYRPPVPVIEDDRLALPPFLEGIRRPPRLSA